MKQIIMLLAMVVVLSGIITCTQTDTAAPTGATTNAATQAGQSAVQDNESQKSVLQVAMGSKDHTTLVAAVKAAGLVDVLSNAGPFTVFAPTDAAFAAIPKETLDNLLKPENKAALSNILEYHVSVGGYKAEMMQEGQKINQVNLKDIVLSKKDGKVMINGKATIVASIPCSNGIVHVIDTVLLPPEK